MFPTPLEKRPRSSRVAYQAFLPLALIMWLLPLLAVAIFSIKPGADFTNANYWAYRLRLSLSKTTVRCSSTPICRATC